MPFGMKNAGATYQRLVNMMFAKLIGKKMEVYVDDMVIMRKNVVYHVVDLKAMFNIQRQF